MTRAKPTTVTQEQRETVLNMRAASNNTRETEAATGIKRNTIYRIVAVAWKHRDTRAAPHTKEQRRALQPNTKPEDRAAMRRKYAREYAAKRDRKGAALTVKERGRRLLQRIYSGTADEEPPRATTLRRCIDADCGTLFESEGPHHRMCPECRSGAGMTHAATLHATLTTGGKRL